MAEDESQPLTQVLLASCLSEIKLAVGGNGYVFTKLDCSDKELTGLGDKIENHEQLRHIVLVNNKIQDVTPLAKLQHLLTLNLEGNAVHSLDGFAAEGVTLPWLQRMNLAGNSLTRLPPLAAAMERLRFASFAKNQIASLEEFGGLPALEELDLSENQLTTLVGLGSMEKLTSLKLASNQLESLEGLNVPELKTLDLSYNKLVSLEHISGVPLCSELDLSVNQLSAEDPHLPELRRLGADLKQLRSLKIAGNVTNDLRMEALVCVPKLKHIDGAEVTDKDKQKAKEKKVELKEAVKVYEAEKAAAGEAADDG